MASSTAAASSGRSAQQEDELHHLNYRLTNYIDRVQELASHPSSILLEEGDKTKSREMGNVRRLYEEELAVVRRSLDGLDVERARLQINHGNLCEEYRKLQARNQKKESDLANALAQWRKVEATLSSKDAEFTKLLSDNRRLDEDLTDLQGQLENVEGELAETKNQLSAEILRRVDLENQVQTLKEQLEFQKNISEQEISEIQSRHESCLAELESGRPREFKSKLAEMMQQIRQDHESQLQQYKEEIDKTFSSKLQNAQQAALEKNNVISATKEELETTKLRVESLNSQLQQCQNDKMVLERTLDGKREVWHQRLNQKEEELLTMRSQMSAQLEDYQKLLDAKMAWNKEIKIYRMLLDTAEQRLQLSPRPSQHSAIPRAQNSAVHEHSSHKLRGKKRKHEGASGSSPACNMSSRSTAHSTVSVAEVDVDGKYVRLKNNSEAEQPLGGWVVRRTYPDSRELSFHIPSSCILAGGQTLTIWAAGAEAEADPGDLILQGHRSWVPITDIRVVLLNPNHEEMAERRVCMQDRGHEKTELDFDEEYVAGSNIQHFQRQPKRKKKKCCSGS